MCDIETVANYSYAENEHIDDDMEDHHPETVEETQIKKKRRWDAMGETSAERLMSANQDGQGKGEHDDQDQVQVEEAKKQARIKKFAKRNTTIPVVRVVNNE